MERRSFLASLAAPAVASIPALPVNAGLLPEPAEEGDIDTRFPFGERRFGICEVYAPDDFEPCSLVDAVAAEGQTGWVPEDSSGLFQTRAHSMLECAGWNGDALRASGGDMPEKWHIVVEIVPAPRRKEEGHVMITMDADGTGDVDITLPLDCHFVEPTEAERAAYPMPAVVEGGAA